MILRNEYNYPAAIMKAVQAEIYKPREGVLRVSELIDSPLIKRLMLKFWDKIEIDVDEVVSSSLFGTAFHKFLAGFESDAMIERRWSVNIGDYIITGQTDIYKPDEGYIEDIKTQSAWAFVFGNKNWERQLNCYAYLIRQNGYPVTNLYINSFLRDWSKYEAMRGRNKDYPKHRFHRIRLPLWKNEDIERYIKERVELHRRAAKGGECICTPEERWQRPTTYALKKKGVKRACRVLPSYKEIVQHIKEKGLTKDWESGRIYVEKREGCNVRCENYCIVRNVCPYRKKEQI